MTTPVDELLIDLKRRLNEMAETANLEIRREQARSEEWCRDRWQRLDRETADLRAQRDAIEKNLANAARVEAVFIQPIT